MTYSNSIAERTETRNTIASTKDKRVLAPLDFNLLTPIIRPMYAEVWRLMLESKTPGIIQVEYTKDNHDAFVAFLRGWILANSYNRESTESHVAELIVKMRDGFSPASTSFSVSVIGAVDNGGHSGKAILRGFFPPSAYYGLHGKPVIVEDTHIDWNTFSDDGDTESGYYFKGSDGLTYESVLPPMPTDTIIVDGVEVEKYPPAGEYDQEDGAYMCGSDTPQLREYCIDPMTGKRKPQQLIINISVFGEPTTLHRENTTLAPTAETYLNMTGSIKTHYAECVPSFLKTKVGSLLTMIRKRTMHSSTGFGTVGRGGRMNGEDAPSWYLAYMPQVLDSLELLVDTQKNQLPRPLFTPAKGDANNPAYKGGANLLQILTAMVVSDQAGRKRIADWVTSTGDAYKSNAGLRKLVDLVRPPKDATTGQLPTDAIVELLVLVGLGKTDPVAELTKDWQRPTGSGGKMESANAWLMEENRASGWDRSDVDSFDDGDDTLSTGLVEFAKQLLGESSRAAKSANRKAPKGKPTKAKK